MLGGAIDYAGLFPPASLTMREAVGEYARQRVSPEAWALGRFVLPLSRHEEFIRTASELPQPTMDAWPVSMLATPADTASIEALIRDHDTRFTIRAVETKLDNLTGSATLRGYCRLGLDVFAEMGQGVDDIDAFVRALALVGAAGKLRTGGTTADAIPDAGEVLEFLRACRRHGVRVKATAGLHHAVRGRYRLTYDADSPNGTMFGFLNVLFAAALLWSDQAEPVVLAALEERSAAAFELGEDAASWRGYRFPIEALTDMRRDFFTGFGSCSFTEPMADVGLTGAVAS